LETSQKTNDLLTNDYCFDRKFKLTAKTNNGVTLTGEGSLGKKFDIKGSAKFILADGVQVDKLQTSSNGRVLCETTFKSLVKNTDVVVKIEDGAGKDPAGSVEVKYSTPKFTFDTSLDVANTIIGASGSFVVSDNVTFGASTKFDTLYDSEKKSSTTLADQFKEVDVACSYTKSDLQVTLGSKEKFNRFVLNVYHDLNPTTQIGGMVDLGKTEIVKGISLGGIYTIDSDSKLQGKVDDKGVVSTNYILQIKPQVKGIVSAQIDALNIGGDAHKFGLSLILG